MICYYVFQYLVRILLLLIYKTFILNNKELINDPSSAGEVEPVFYTVHPGDTLGSIAKKLYVDGRRGKMIYTANRDKIDDPKISELKLCWLFRNKLYSHCLIRRECSFRAMIRSRILLSLLIEVIECRASF